MNITKSILLTFLLSISFYSFGGCNSDVAVNAIDNDIRVVFNTGDFSVFSTVQVESTGDYMEYSSYVSVCYDGEQLEMTYQVGLLDLDGQCLVESVNPISSVVVGSCNSH